ncbi:DUF1284 domain-containing protein [bacterium]|nr:DUF1284 domain-containing protein [bacterium]
MIDESTNQNSNAIKLRAHHILCFHGYNGRGYNEEFISNMNRLKEIFLTKPETEIQIISSPDCVCESCPNLSDDACFEDNEPDQEKRIHDRDLAVMSCLEISEGEVMSVKDAFERAESRISSEKLREICYDCPWLPISSCAKNIEISFWD